MWYISLSVSGDMFSLTTPLALLSVSPPSCHPQLSAESCITALQDSHTARFLYEHLLCGPLLNNCTVVGFLFNPTWKPIWKFTIIGSGYPPRRAGSSWRILLDLNVWWACQYTRDSRRFGGKMACGDSHTWSPCTKTGIHSTKPAQTRNVIRSWETLDRNVSKLFVSVRCG